MTGTSPGLSSDPDRLARVVHETRRNFGAALDRPMTPAPWGQRHPRQQQLDRDIAGAVAAAVREQDGARLAEVVQVVTTFRNHHGGSLHPQADALAHAVLQVIDKVPLGGQEQERGDEEAASPVAAELDGQLPLPGVAPLETSPDWAGPVHWRDDEP